MPPTWTGRFWAVRRYTGPPPSWLTTTAAPDAYLPDLAASLNNLSATLADVGRERQLAQTRAVEEALAAILQVAAELDTDHDVVDRLCREYEEHLLLLQTTGADDAQPLRHDQQYTALRLALLARKRATVIRLRDERLIDDTVLRQLQTRLDIEEVRLSRGELVD